MQIPLNTFFWLYTLFMHDLTKKLITISS